MNKLPDIPSELITLALNDLLKVEKRKGYKVDMSVWHEPDNKVCLVCLAGAVLACEYGLDKRVEVDWDEIGEEASLKADALNCFRTGGIDFGFESLKLDQDLGQSFNRVITKYSDDRLGFYRDMRKLVRDLRKQGL